MFQSNPEVNGLRTGNFDQEGVSFFFLRQVFYNRFGLGLDIFLGYFFSFLFNFF